MPDILFSRQDIIDNLRAVADILAAGGHPQTRIIVVGGSYMALHGLREATRDIDTITALDEAVNSAVHEVARHRGLAPHWLNAHARPWTPAGLRDEDCHVLLEHPNLLVLGPPADHVFLMKLSASRTPDVNDMVALWPLCGFADAGDVVNRFYAAYPNEEPDPFMTDHVQRMINAAEARC
ncbi:MAG: hypothetical protein ACYDDW_18990 [Dermatophilaceae bacterium]